MRVGEAIASISREYRERRPVPGVELPDEQEIRSAIGAIPEDFNWDWARPRLTPLFDRPDAAGLEGDPLLHAVTPLGVAVAFGIEIGPLFASVSRSMAERWEASVEQIEQAAFAHLAEAVARVRATDLQHAVHRGHMARALPEPAGWASSVILAGEAEVIRIFGPQDQVFTAPTRNALLSFDSTVPPQAIAEISMLMEQSDPHPLLIDPFVLEGGRLSWDGSAVGAAFEQT